MKLFWAACGISFLVLVAAPASAELTVNAGVDHMSWGGNSTETDGGNILGAGLSYTQDGSTGLLMAYRGRLTFGETDFTGVDEFNGLGIGGTSKNFLLGNEIQLRKRSPYEKEHVMDIVMGAGWEHWVRTIPVSKEKRTYDTAYFRLGIEFDTEARKEGWIGGIGLKYPLVSKVKRNLSSEGLGTISLKPARDFSTYLQLGYRIDPAWSILWYYDGFRFRASDTVDAPGAFNDPMTLEKFNVSFTGLRVQYSF
jgi:hypothetical protein